MRKLIGKKCDYLESMLGRPREITKRVDQGIRGNRTTTEIWFYEDATAICTDGRITSVRSVESRGLERGHQDSPVTRSVAPWAPPASVIATKPRFSEDRQTLVLLEEIREPLAQRQPEVALKVNPATTTRQITVGARGMVRLSKILIGCEEGPRELTFSTFSETPNRNTASFTVPSELAANVLAASNCYLSIAGALIPLPRDLLSTVWGATAMSGAQSRHNSGAGPLAQKHPFGCPTCSGRVRYVDELGTVHWVSSFEQVPDRYREQVLEQGKDNPFFEPTTRSQASGQSPPLEWQLVRRDFEDFGKRLTRNVLKQRLSVNECLGLMKSMADHDSDTEVIRTVTTKSGHGIGVIRRGYRDVSVRVWQCVEQE